MTVTTQQCKDFIHSNMSIIGIQEREDWTRVRKYNQDNLTLRDFESSHMRQVTIAEDEKGKLSFYSLTQPQNKIQEKGVKILSGSASEKDIYQFIQECISADNGLLQDPKHMRHANKSDSWMVYKFWGDMNQQCIGEPHGTLEDFRHEMHEYNFQYPNALGCEIKESDVLYVFWVGMHHYGSIYRFFVYETHDHKLMLGVNEGE